MRLRILGIRVPRLTRLLATIAYLSVNLLGLAQAQSPDTAVGAPALGKWQTYMNERYAFRLSYPLDGQMRTLRDGRHQHVQIKNYHRDADAPQALAPGDYDIEVWIYDHRLGHKPGSACNTLLHESRGVKLGKVRGLRGRTDPTEDGNTTFAVCMESGKLQILVTASEQDPLGPVANRILDTVRFGN